MSNDVTLLEIGDEELDTLFGEVAPEKTFKAGDLTTAQKKEDTTTEKTTTQKNQKPNNSEKKEETPEVTEISEEDENELFTTETEEEVKTPKKVSKEEKDEAKALGCIWDIERKQWYITESNPHYDKSPSWCKWLRFY